MHFDRLRNKIREEKKPNDHIEDNKIQVLVEKAKKNGKVPAEGKLTRGTVRAAQEKQHPPPKREEVKTKQAESTSILSEKKINNVSLSFDSSESELDSKSKSEQDQKAFVESKPLPEEAEAKPKLKPNSE